MMQKLETQLERMRVPPDDESIEFHALTLTADVDGQIILGMHTRWVGWTDAKRRVELRQSRIVDATHAQVWDCARLPFYFVTRKEELLIFLLAGGNALIERSIAEATFSFIVQLQPAYQLGEAGFVDANLLQGGSLRRAPSPKLRMAVLKRDDRRCRICGRRPDDHVDVELHVHHIRPWESGGVTDISNLITLCHTCHHGLDPHFDRGLFEYVEQRDGLTSLADFDQGVANYRRVSSLAIARP